MKKNILVLFGGASNEHEVSLTSAVNVLQNICKNKYNVITVGITKHGQWLLYEGSVENIKNGKWQDSAKNSKAAILLDSLDPGLLITKDGESEILAIDVVFPVLHGKNGEDGTVQGLLEIAGIPFVGCNSSSSANCMDKVTTNILLENAGIKKAKWLWFYPDEYSETKMKEIENKLAYPVFVKPARSGSSVGISRVASSKELKAAVAVAAKEDRKILVEEGIKGQELECALLGNSDLIASVVGEINPPDDFYDYNAKYLDDTSGLHIPANISTKESDAIREIAIKAYKAMECSGLARIDFFLQKGTNKIILNEINTMPGFTDISMYPKLMNEIGINGKQLINRLIELAIERTKKYE